MESSSEGKTFEMSEIFEILWVIESVSGECFNHSPTQSI